MRKSISLLLFLFSTSAFSQNIDEIIKEQEVLRIEKTLSSDEMSGRKPATAGIEKAAGIIDAEFAKSNLSFLPDLKSYWQEFSLYKTKLLSANMVFDGVTLDMQNVKVYSREKTISRDDAEKIETIIIPADSNLNNVAARLLKGSKNLLVLVDTAHASDFGLLKNVKADPYSKLATVIFVLASRAPKKYSIEIKQDVVELKFANIVGVLPGKSKKDEYVIFSAHYDHLGFGKANATGDSIYNGANDDAAGTTAVIMLSKYFSRLKNNERSIIFAAFTAEELGGLGSKYFSKQLDPGCVSAMFNIEMIGTESKWGTNSAYITGYEKSDFGSILNKSLKGSKFTFYPDPYTAQDLFYRSDNASLAALGVPAHTISTSKMDDEPYYHSVDDEIETLDIQNMTEIIKAIAISSTGILKGTDTPFRVTLQKNTRE